MTVRRLIKQLITNCNLDDEIIVTTSRGIFQPTYNFEFDEDCAITFYANECYIHLDYDSVKWNAKELENE